MTPLAPGAEVHGRYRLERVLGSGGMGEVWSALHLITHKRVALKVLKADSESDARDESLKRFFREARAISAVNHPNVVAVHDLFEHDGYPIMVMDLLEGESLASKLERAITIELHELAGILLPVISAVGTAHARGIVHRDLKPENVFLALSPSGAVEPKVLDFGIAKLSPTAIEAEQSEALTNTGTLLGTPFFMAPEQVFGEKALDARCDVWAMGVLLYLCLCGRRPFDGDNVGQIFKSVLTRCPLPLRVVRPGVPADVSKLVERMLEKDVHARCPDLREAFEVISRHADALPPAFGPPASVTPGRVTSAPPLARSSSPDTDAPTELSTTSEWVTLSALTPPSKHAIFALLGAATAIIATAAVVLRSQAESAGPPVPGTSFERSVAAAGTSEPPPQATVSPALAHTSRTSPEAHAPAPPAPELVAPVRSVASSRSHRSRAASTDPKPVAAAPVSTAPATLPGGILDQERAPF